MMDSRDELLELLGKRLPDGVLLVDGAGCVVAANPAAGRTLSVTPEELCGRQLQDLVTTDPVLLASYLRSCAGSRQAVPGVLAFNLRGKFRRFRCDGALLSAAAGDNPSISYLRLRDLDDANSSFAMLTAKVEELEREVATRMRVEALLEGQRAILELVARAAPLDETLDELVRITEAHSPGGQRVSILLLDENRCLRDTAGSGLPLAYRQAIDGVEIGPSVGSCGTAAFENRSVIVSDIATDPLWEDYRDLALSHGLAACWSTPIRARDGSVLGTFALYYPEPRKPRTEDQRVVEIMTRVASIAIERRTLDERVRLLLESERAARAEAESANRSKDEFLAMVSHELRNPLNAIMGWVQLLADGGLEGASFTKAIETIERNARLQADLIGDVFDFARITSGRLTLELEPTSLRSVVEKACESVRPEAERQGLTLTVDVSVSDGVFAADSNRLQQAVSNVLWNAIKFTPHGGHIRVQLTEDGSVGRIRVSDTGCGIDPAFLPSVYERFRQSYSGTNREHGGLGLGLAIVRHIVELHGGQVDAASQGRGQGATFTLSLPLRPMPEAGESSAVRPPMAQTLHGVHVLTVEDAPDTRELLEVAFARSGAKVTSAATAAQALDLLGREAPDVLVCDIGLPETDGYTFVRRWRAHAALGGRPAVALTAYGRDVDRQRALDSGFDRHLTKPIDPAELVATVAELIATR